MATKKKKTIKIRTQPPIYREPEALRLDLGSGPRPADGFKGCDIVPGQTDYTFNLCDGGRWPFKDNTVDELRSSHFIEHMDAVYLNLLDGNGVHVRRIDALLWFFDEAFRIAKPGALFTVQWPALQSVRAFQDPTHRRFIPHSIVYYLSVEGRKNMGVAHYGATCNWIGTVQPTINIAPETEEDKAMALRADSSDDKQKWQAAKNLAQQHSFDREWNFSQDFIAHLKAVK